MHGICNTSNYAALLKLSAEPSTPVFLNRRAVAQYQTLTSIIPGRERPEESTICYKI